MEKSYLIFNLTELSLINFEEVLETSAETIRISNDGVKAIIKWGETTPNFIDSLTTKDGPYTHEEISNILLSNEWQILN
jgi:hypothetical protein